MLLLAKVKLSVTSIQGKILKALLELEANIYWLIDVLCRIFFFFSLTVHFRNSTITGDIFWKENDIDKIKLLRSRPAS